MEVWIIRDGEKIGPIHDFEIRRKITTGELPATTPAWHEGCGPWKPLGEIEIFRREFDNVTAPETQEAPQTEVTAADKNEPSEPSKWQPALIRRFWARWLDLSFYSGVWWLGMWVAGQDIQSAMSNPWIMFFHFVPWFVVEALLLSQFATTPGKWLLGLRVLNNDGSQLDLTAATRRSMRVLFIGIGFGWNYLAFFCQILSVVVVKRIGSTLWDHTGGHQVTVAPLHFSRVIAFISAFFAAMMLQSLVLFPYVAKEVAQRNPEYKEYFEKYPPWGLPPRK